MSRLHIHVFCFTFSTFQVIYTSIQERRRDFERKKSGSALAEPFRVTTRGPQDHTHYSSDQAPVIPCHIHTITLLSTILCHITYIQPITLPTIYPLQYHWPLVQLNDEDGGQWTFQDEHQATSWATKLPIHPYTVHYKPNNMIFSTGANLKRENLSEIFQASFHYGVEGQPCAPSWKAIRCQLSKQIKWSSHERLLWTKIKISSSHLTPSTKI